MMVCGMSFVTWRKGRDNGPARREERRGEHCEPCSFRGMHALAITTANDFLWSSHKETPHMVAEILRPPVPIHLPSCSLNMASAPLKPP
jgi:hypothetical protein